MLTIRLTRVGTTRRPFYRVVVMESRVPRDGRFVESLGYYNPRADPEVVEVDHDRVAYWIGKGARPSDTVRTLLARHPAPPAPPEGAAAPAEGGPAASAEAPAAPAEGGPAAAAEAPAAPVEAGPAAPAEGGPAAPGGGEPAVTA